MNKDYPDVTLTYLGACGKNLVAHTIQSGNFCLKLPDGFADKPIETVMSDANRGFCFSGRSEAEWVYVEHLKIGVGHESDDIENWVEAGLAILGKPMLHSPDQSASHDCEALKFERVPAISKTFMQRHRADDMITYVGTIRYKGIVCRVFILCLRRGNESWMVEYAFPAYITESRTEGDNMSIAELRPPKAGEDIPPIASQGEMQLAGVVLGNFRAYDARTCFICGKIVSDDDSFVVKMDDVKVFDDMPLRGSATITVPCCRSCLSKIGAKGVDLKRLMSNEVVSKVLQDGGKFNDEWKHEHTRRNPISRFISKVFASAIIAIVVCGCRYDRAVDACVKDRPIAAQVAIYSVREGLDAGSTVETTVVAVSKKLSRWYDIGVPQKEALENFCREAGPLLYEWRQIENKFVSLYDDMVERFFDIDGYSYSLKQGKEFEFGLELSILNAKLYGMEPFGCMPLPSDEEGVF